MKRGILKGMNCVPDMSGDDIEALLNELDGIDYSPLRPWPAAKQDPRSLKGPTGCCDLSEKETDLKSAQHEDSNEVHSRRPTVVDHGDVEDEIDGLLGDLGGMDAKGEDDPLSTTVARRISGDNMSAGFEIAKNGPTFKPNRLCPERVTVGCAEEQGSRPTMEARAHFGNTTRFTCACFSDHGSAHANC